MTHRVLRPASRLAPLAALLLFTVLASAGTARGQATLPADVPDRDELLRQVQAVLRQTAQLQARAEQLQARAEANRAREVEEYNRRADAQEQEQRRQYEEAQARTWWVWGVALAIVILMLVWGPIAMRASMRKQVAAVEAARAQADAQAAAARAQGDRVIALLEAIDRNLAAGGRP